MIRARSRKRKGETLEILTSYLLGSLEGIIIECCDQRTDCEEIDIVLWNNQTDNVLRIWDAIILVECKNWQSKVGASDVDLFISKLRRRKLQHGILVARNGVTGTLHKDAKEIITEALSKGIKIIVFTRDDLNKIDSIEACREIIRKKYCHLVIEKII